MPPEGPRRRKSPHLFDLMLIPVGEGERTRTLHLSRNRLIALVLGVLVLFTGLMFALFFYSPLAHFMPISNEALEARYGTQLSVQQQQLTVLERDVLLLKDYNTQLRKALGEGSSGDSTTTSGGPSLAIDDGGEQQGSSPAHATPAQQAATEPQSSEESVGGLVVQGGSVVTADAGGRSTFPLLMPVEGRMTQGFDPAQSHYGVDFAGKRGTPVHAAADGRVVFAGWTSDDGNVLILAHEGGYLTVYKHNQALLVPVQSAVHRGEPVALLGNSGQTSMGPHLHFEMWRNGVPRDPAAYLLLPEDAPASAP